MNDSTQKIDKLTGNTYESELNMYVRYHGLSVGQAAAVLEKQTHRERDELFNAITN